MLNWIKSTDRLPPAGRVVKMKWADGETEWYGDIIRELADLKPQHYENLLWFGNTDSPHIEVVEYMQRLINGDRSDATYLKHLIQKLTHEQ